MERFIGTDTASVELFFNIFTSGIETFVIPRDQLSYPCAVEVFALKTEGNHEKNPNQFGQYQDLNWELSDYESSVMNFDRDYALYVQKLISQTAFHGRRMLE